MLFLLVFVANCGRQHNQTPEQQYYKISGFTQGTTYTIVYSTDNEADYSQAIDSLLSAFNMSLSIYEEQSLISRINNNDSTVVADQWLLQVVEKGKEISKATDGAFDMTVGALVSAWGFGYKDTAAISPHLIAELLQYVDYTGIEIQNGKILKKQPQIKIDANAIAQGFSVDIVAEFLDNCGVMNYMVEIGGELCVKGRNPEGEAWKIGIDKPIENSNATDRELQTVLLMNADSLKALATSGSYRRFYEKNGIKYSHTIDPKTGYPVKHNLLSVTVLTNNCLSADAYATAFMVMGWEKSLTFVEQQPNMEAYFIIADTVGSFRTVATKGFKKLISE